MVEQEIEITLSNLASERAVLAGIFNHGMEAFVDVDNLVSEECFTYTPNKVLFNCIQDCIKSSQNIGITEILSSAQNLGLSEYFDKPKIIKHINGIINTPIDLENVYHHCVKIRRLQFARKVQNELKQIHKNIDDVTGDESISEILSLAESPIQEICFSYMKEDENTPKLIGDGLEEYIAHLIENKCDQIGIPTGYPEWDRTIGGGLRRKCVDLVAARTKAGKSVLADNVAIEVARNQNIPVLMLDTEMSTEDHYNRLLANIAEVDVNLIGSGKFADDPETKDRVFMAMEEIKKMPYHYINISGRPFEESLSIARRWILKVVGYNDGQLNDCLLIYDYLKLMSGGQINNNMAEFQILGFQITSLHNFCVQYDIPCLALVQANRDGITKESTDVISGSDRLVWLCTSCSILKEKTVEEIATDGPSAGNRKLVTIVTRHGPGMQDESYICLNMQGQYAKMTELGTIRGLQQNEQNNQQGVPESTDSDTGIEDQEDDSGIPSLF